MALATRRPGWASGLRECEYRYIDDHGAVADGRAGEENGFIGLCFQIVSLFNSCPRPFRFLFH